MKKGYIAVIDSGIGGLSVLNELNKSIKGEKFIYYGDNGNAPYGNKRKDELINLSNRIINEIKEYPIKGIVLACNTLSTTVLKEIRELSKVPVYPIFPPVEREIKNGKRVLLLCTENTAKNYIESEKLKIMPLKSLAKEIESKAFNIEGINVKEHINFDKNGFDTLILGCTHYNFVKNQIFNAFCPPRITDGTQFVVNNLKKDIKSGNRKENANENEFLFLGNNADLNGQIWEKVVCKWSSL